MSYKNTILEKIVDAKKQEISSSKFRESFADLRVKAQSAAPTRSFLKALDPEAYQKELPETRIIAEIKKASPSAGLIRSHFDPVQIAHEYLEAGAAALSVLTDPPFFQGSLEHLQAVREMSPRPLLRKDFIIDPYQVYQSRVYGADCILAIVAILEKQQLVDLCELSKEIKMNVLVEIHDEKELEIILNVGATGRSPLLGINNRDLKTLKIDLSTTERLMSQIPTEFTVVAESGISNRSDVVRMLKAGVKGLLIGEKLLKAKDIKTKFNEFIGK
jgi:indole-3-glycerol phosphate synthase